MPYTIERANNSDFLGIAALDRMAWPSVPDTYIPDGEHIWRVWCEHATVLRARLESGETVGALVMFPTSKNELFLHKIMVHPKHRGQGIGSDLMRTALGQADAPVLLTVDPQNAAAIQLYRNFGFEVREHVPGYYRPHEDRDVMAYDK
jgi:[ribosomal protein S18]-alanine N-acetyltransferase